MYRMICVLALLGLAMSCAPPMEYDVIIRNGTIYDGSGSAGYRGDVAVQGDRIAAVGDIGRGPGWTP